MIFMPNLVDRLKGIGNQSNPLHVSANHRMTAKHQRGSNSDDPFEQNAELVRSLNPWQLDLVVLAAHRDLRAEQLELVYTFVRDIAQARDYYRALGMNYVHPSATDWWKMFVMATLFIARQDYVFGVLKRI